MLRKIYFLSILFLFLFFCGIKREEKVFGLAKEQVLEESPSLQKIDNFTLEGFTETGKKRWELRADSADVEEDLVKMKHVKATIWGEEGSVNLESNKGAYDKKENKISLIENVLIKTSEGTRLTTERLVWDVQRQEANTNDEVVVEKENLTAKGKGATALTEVKKVELKENVEVRVEPKTVITCKGPLELEYDKNMAKFYEDVEVVDERGKIYADRMDVFFNPQDKKIEKVFAYGNVRILHEGNTAYAEEAVYEAKESRVILKGKPKLVIGVER